MPVTYPPPCQPQMLADVPAHHARVRGGGVALRFEGIDFSHANLAHRIERAASRLFHEWGVRAGDRVAYLGLNHADQLVALFALARIGAMLAPLNFRLAPPEWDAVLADCTPRLVLHDAAWAEAAHALAQRAGVPAHPLDSLCALPAEGDAPRHADAQAPVLLVYTSGTTGAPKGAVHTQANLLAGMAIAAQAQAITPRDTIATVLPLFHVGGLCIQTLPALFAGARVVLHARFDPAATLACFRDEGATLTVQVPATMKALIAHPDWARTGLSGLRAVWAGSSTLPQDLVEAFHARGVPVCNVYGATETGPFSIALPPEHAFARAGSCGWPAAGVEARLGEGAGDASDGVGEVLLRGPNVVRHYWPARDALDAEGWFRTGDLARRDADGSYTIVGRAKDMIISGGENIYPAEIENALARHSDVADCAVLGVPDAQWGEAVVAAVVLRDGAAVSDEALAAFLQPQLARYKLPRRYVRLQALPKTALGKVQKALLLAQLR